MHVIGNPLSSDPRRPMYVERTCRDENNFYLTSIVDFL